MQPARVALAYSGGPDSTALLHATLAATRGTGLQVVALHVHHGLMADADGWLAHCRETCRRWARGRVGLRFDFRRLEGAPRRGESVEAWARRERYRALGEMARLHGASAVLLAQHRQDQAETWLLQALRGAGVAGLAAMPRSIEREGLTWLRPWLGVSRADIEDYLVRHRLHPIHDPSNDDPRFARSRLRSKVWPALVQAFPEAEASLASAAAWAQEASAVLAEVAREDLARVSDDEGLHVATWAGLSPARRSNVLRAWLVQALGHAAATGLVQRLGNELARSGSSRWPLAAGGELCRYRDRLRYRSCQSAPMRPAADEVLTIKRAGIYRVPGWPGTLRATRVAAQGLALPRAVALRVLARSGGERFQIGPGRPPRSLKKQFQSLAVAAWDREGPLLYAGKQLVFVSGLGVDARAWAEPGEPQLALRWVPDGQADDAG